jgi:hypothetical protein
MTTPHGHYEQFRRAWIESVDRLNGEASARADEHCRRVWPFIYVTLLARCPRWRQFKNGRTAVFEDVLDRAVMDHVQQCTCRLRDWDWTRQDEDPTVPTS